MVFCCVEAARLYGLEGQAVVGRRGIGAPPSPSLVREPPDPAFVEQVDALLPPQPWKVGVHALVAKELGTSPDRVYAAIQLLITSNRRNRQKDGIVYNTDGSVLTTDPDRVPRK
jgi:hypothetical protein